jgi:hypothetical protein
MGEPVVGEGLASAETVWVCGCCGRRARTRRGFDEAGKSTVIDPGYDSSCTSNAVLCYTGRTETGTWVAVTPLPTEEGLHEVGGKNA